MGTVLLKFRNLTFKGRKPFVWLFFWFPLVPNGRKGRRFGISIWWALGSVKSNFPQFSAIASPIPRQSCKSLAIEQKTPNIFTFDCYHSALGNESVRIRTETNILIILQQKQKSTDGLNYVVTRISEMPNQQ